MKEKIGEVTLNYKYYTENEPCSNIDDIEETLLEAVRTGEDLELRLQKEENPAFLYHFSPIRQNVLRWFEFDSKASLLEIGAGCGAITGLFCENVEQVVAIDLSKRRSTINATRHKQYSNLEIYVGNFADITLEQKFDYISLIGVLEYSAYYMDSQEPFLDLLKKVKTMLKPGGKILIATENKYGLKYWAGAPETYTGGLFEGIEGYEKEESVRTFSKKSLKKLLENAGFSKNAFYYPVPDYRLPLEIYSEKHLPKSGDITNISPAYDRPRYEFFDERLAFSTICEDGLFEGFANSFIVVSE